MNQMNMFDAKENAKIGMAKRLLQGEAEEKALVQKVAAMVIQDKLVPPLATQFGILSMGELEKDFRFSLRISYPGLQDQKIHRHAMGQLCQKVELPISFANKLSAEKELWKLSLLQHNLNELVHKTEWKEQKSGPTRFLHRIVDGELRGFLSRRYNRYLASRPLLQAFAEQARMMGARPVEGTYTDVRVALKYLFPEAIEVFPGEFVGIGTEWSNSDFGAGKLTVCQTIWRLKTQSSSVLDESISRVHLGSIIEDSDIEMSDETAQKEVSALQSAIRDAVSYQLATDTMERMIVAIRAAHDEQVPWTKLRGLLGRFLSKADVAWVKGVLDGTGATVVDLPPVSFSPEGERVPNLWWASSAVSSIAQATSDLDKKLELQRAAGALLSKSVPTPES